jgi:type I restriction enzyme S subunit
MNLVPFESLFAEPLRNGVSYPSGKRGSGVRMVNMGEAFRFDIITDQECERVPLKKEELGRYLLSEDDLLFVRQSLKYEGAGRCILVGDSKEARTWDSHLIRVRLDRNVANSRFYFYFFRSPVGRQLMGTIIEQVSAAGIRGSDLRRLNVPCPSVHRQALVSDILKALDNKIIVNERISQTALDLGSASYDAASSSSDWMEVTLAQAAKWYSGGTPSTAEPTYWNGDIPWISAVSLKSPWLGNSDRRVTDLGVTNGTRVVPKGSVIFVVRGMSLKAEFRVGLAQRDVAFGQDCKALIPLTGLGGDLLFHAIRNRTADVLDLVDEAGHGTGRLATDRIERMVVRVPSVPSDRANEALRSLNDLAASRQQESRTLAELRDTLLPRLMSGEIRVREAEKVMEDVL